jgi:hypothetical protein
MADNSGVRKLSAMPRYLPLVRSEVLIQGRFFKIEPAKLLYFLSWDPFS